MGEQEEEPLALLMPECRYELRAVECLRKTHASPNQTKSQHGRGCWAQSPTSRWGVIGNY